MRTQVELSITLSTLTSSQNLIPNPNGYIIKIYLACSQVNSYVFRLHSNSNVVHLNQSFKIKNILARELELWMCSAQGKIIASGNIKIAEFEKQNSSNFVLQLKMLQTKFAVIEGTLEIRSYQIEKKIQIEPDQQLLKKVEDPQQKQRKQEEQAKKVKELAEAQQAAKNVKKHAITVTRFNKKDQPFV